MRGLVPKFIMLIICLLHINYRPFDPCERVLTVFNKLQHSMIFRPVLIKKNAYLQLMTSIIYRLDIALAAPKKNFLDERKKGRQTTN